MPDDFDNYSINIGEDVEIREAENVRKKVNAILESCPGEIIDSLRQLAAFTKAGFEVYDWDAKKGGRPPFLCFNRKKL